MLPCRIEVTMYDTVAIQRPRDVFPDTSVNPQMIFLRFLYNGVDSHQKVLRHFKGHSKILLCTPTQSVTMIKPPRGANDERHLGSQGELICLRSRFFISCTLTNPVRYIVLIFSTEKSIYMKDYVVCLVCPCNGLWDLW